MEGQRPHGQKVFRDPTVALVNALQSTAYLGRIYRDEETVGNGKDGETRAPLCMQCHPAALGGAKRYLGAIQDVGVPFPLS